MTKQPETILALLALVLPLIISNIGFWIREWRKHLDWKAKNGDIKEIKKTVHSTNVSVAKIEEKVDGMKNHCQNTVQSVFREINANRDKLFELAKKENK